MLLGGLCYTREDSDALGRTLLNLVLLGGLCLPQEDSSIINERALSFMREL